MFKKGDMVECVDRGCYTHLTNGKIYEVHCSENDECIKVTVDSGYVTWYHVSRFVKVTPPPIKAGDTVECVDADNMIHITKGNIYEVVKAVGDRVLVIDDDGDSCHLYKASRFKKVTNKPKQEQAKGDCMIYSTIIVTKDKDGKDIAVEGQEFSIAKNKGEAIVNRTLKSADILKDNPDKSVEADVQTFEGV